MGTRGSSTDKCSSSSIIYGGNTSLETIDMVLQQLKPKLTEANRLKENETHHGMDVPHHLPTYSKGGVSRWRRVRTCGAPDSVASRSGVSKSSPTSPFDDDDASVVA